MIDITGLREDKRPQSSTIVHALIDRLEAAEKERDEFKRACFGHISDNSMLRAKIAEMEKQEPYSYIYEYANPIDGRPVWRDTPGYWNAQYPRSSKPLYALPGAQNVPKEAIAKILTEVMNIAVSNGADSRSMPDEYVEVAAWLCGIPAQPAPSFADAYQGAMEEVAIWKKRALEAEDLNRKFIAEINGPTHMGEPAQPSPSAPNGWLRAIDEALVVAHIGVANPNDTYEQAKAKLDNLIGFNVDVATDPAVNGGYKLMPIEPTKEIYECFSAYDGTSYSNPFDFDDFSVDYAFALEAAPEPKP